MIEILPIKSLTDEDVPIFGKLNVYLGKLARSGLKVGSGIVVTAPNLKLKTTLEHYDFGKKEVFEQSLTLVKKEIRSTPIPDIFYKEIGRQKHFLLNQSLYKSEKDLWIALLESWLEQVKQRLWKDGFSKGITENLDSQVVIFGSRLEAFGNGFFDSIQDDTVLNVKFGKLHPNDLKILDGLVKEANKKLFIPHEYEWILDKKIKLVKVLPHTPQIENKPYVSDHSYLGGRNTMTPRVPKSAVKVFLDFSKGLVVEKEVDGVYIAAEKIFDPDSIGVDLNKPNESFENLVFKLVESAVTFPDKPIFYKLADKSEGMGRVRGTLRLLHQKSLLDPLLDAMDFVRHKKGLTNVHIVVPFVRSKQEFLQIKRELAVKKLSRKASLQLWMEASVPENILNLESYLEEGLDGVVLNLDELIGFIGGFDKEEGELVFYKNEVDSLLRFLEDGIKLLNKSKTPFIAYGSISLSPKVLDFLVEKGIYGIVVERYEAQSSYEVLRQAEKRLISRKSS